jgi:hypothetical protein
MIARAFRSAGAAPVTKATSPPGDSFTRERLAWLEQVAADGTLPALAARLAIVLCARYFNRASRTAWPAIATLAGDLGMAPRSIQRIVAAMSPRHLSVEAGGGRSATNTYRWRIDGAETASNRPPFSEPQTPTEMSPFRHPKPRQECQGIETETLTKLSRNPDKIVQKTLTKLSPESLRRNPLRNPFESISVKTDFFEDSAGSAKEATKKANKKPRIQASESDFETFWQQYPKRVSKAAAEKAYRRAIAAGASQADIMAGVMRYSAERSGQDPQFTKHASTWLNGGCWHDEPQASPNLAGNSHNLSQPRRHAGGISSALAGVASFPTDELE